MAPIYGLVLVAKGDVKKIKLPSTLSEKDLQDLLKKKTNATNLGSYEYDEYYLKDLQHTIEILEPLLKCDDSIYYSSSW